MCIHTHTHLKEKWNEIKQDCSSDKSNSREIAGCWDRYSCM